MKDKQPIMTKKIILSSSYASIISENNASQIPLINITHPLFNASLSLYGGHVLSWQPKAHKEIFWLSKTAEYQSGKAIRGGVPICWPWFGSYMDQDKNRGNHGFARNIEWQLLDYVESKAEVKFILKLSGERLHEAWPFKFELKQEIILGEHFSQKLIMSNFSDQPVKFSSALHSYFAVSHPKNTIINQLNNKRFDNKITNQKGMSDELANCVGPLDRIYYDDQIQSIIDTKWQRKISVTSNNCKNWVLWNPGKKIAQTMPDIHQGGENEYVCLEAANTAWLSIPAGQSFEVGQIINVQKL